MAARGGAETGRSTCSTRAGAMLPNRAMSGAGGGATALHRLQCSQACPGIRSGLLGVSSPAGLPAPRYGR